MASPSPAAPLLMTLSDTFAPPASSGFHRTSEKHRRGSLIPTFLLSANARAASAARRAAPRAAFTGDRSASARDIDIASAPSSASGSGGAPSVNAPTPGTHSRTSDAGTNWCSFDLALTRVPALHCNWPLLVEYHIRNVPGSNPGLRFVCTTNAAPSMSARRSSTSRRSRSKRASSLAPRNRALSAFVAAA